MSEQRNYKQPPPSGSARNILLTLAFGMIGASLLLAQVDGQPEADSLISSASASANRSPLIAPPVELTRLAGTRHDHAALAHATGQRCAPAKRLGRGDR